MLHLQLPQDNAKLLQQLKSGFKGIINCNKYQTKVIIQAKNRYLDYLFGPRFQEVNKLFVLSFLDGTVITGYGRYFLPNVQILNYNFTIESLNILINQLKVILISKIVIRQ